ncbi:glutathione S-transferase [Rhodanobacter caeni]|uniref:Glutathione S-transferase n=1 Tax=Rhodanobacter caeni TaxID=657654 RepID=A0ABP3E070_9GAMM
MRLIGMLDSPYVRRVAISLECLGLPFGHEAISVFSTYEEFRAINPVVKAPSLVCDDGEVLMDSSLILQFVEATRTGGDSLWSLGDATRMQHQMRAVSLALAACEKSVQIVYERKLRPSSAQYEPWVERVQGQLLEAYAGLEREVQTHHAVFAQPRNQASITTAVVWQFTQSMLASIVPAEKHPGLAELSARMERTPEFLKYPPVDARG